MKALQWKTTTLWPLHWYKAISWSFFVKNAANSSVIAFWWHLNIEAGKAARPSWSVSFPKRWIPTLAARLDGLDTARLKEWKLSTSLKETNLLEVSKWWKLWKTALKVLKAKNVSSLLLWSKAHENSKFLQSWIKFYKSMKAVENCSRNLPLFQCSHANLKGNSHPTWEFKPRTSMPLQSASSSQIRRP